MKLRQEWLMRLLEHWKHSCLRDNATHTGRTWKRLGRPWHRSRPLLGPQTAGLWCDEKFVQAPDEFNLLMLEMFIAKCVGWRGEVGRLSFVKSLSSS